MNPALDGMHDIIPPAPVHGGLTGLMEQGGLPPGLLVGLIVLLLILAAALWLGRHRLIAGIRQRRALGALRAGRFKELEALIRHHAGMANLHPEHPPHGYDASVWRALVEGLHASRFGRQPLESATMLAALRRLFSAPPLRARGGGAGGRARRYATSPKRSSPSPQPAPLKGEGANSEARP